MLPLASTKPAKPLGDKTNFHRTTSSLRCQSEIAERRIGQYVIGPEVFVQIEAERVGIHGAEVAFDAAKAKFIIASLLPAAERSK